MNFKHQSLRKDKKAISPALSTVILTAAGVVMILVAMSYANGILNSRMADNEFTMNKQFMQTAGLQMDDVAWTIGRSQTITYSSKYGQIAFQPQLVNYTIEVFNSTGKWETIATTLTGAIMYNMHVSSYSMGNNYFERIPTSANGSIVQNGSSAPVSQVFCVERLPMSDGSYLRVVAVPTIRMLTTTLTDTNQSYTTFYLPSLENGTNLYKSQSITLTGAGISKIEKSGINQTRITVSFPNSGFSSVFFNFSSNSVTLNGGTSPKIASNSVIVLYIGKVVVTIGQV